jgi:hypothetical protein
MAIAEEVRSRGSSKWAGRWPPLALLVVGFVMVIAILPSALNLPQANPATTPEYAPVPPGKDNGPPPPNGNLAALGLGSSSGITDTGPGPNGGGSAPPPPADAVVRRNPSTKRCVGNPPRQTDDPLSPPCVGFFKGDNFGATYAGVTKDEVRILFYMESGSYCGTSQGCVDSPVNAYDDLGQPPSDNEYIIDHELRIWQRYFNDRFQTYGRFVHFFVYWTNSYTTDETPEQRRADAADNYDHVKPFAVISFAKANGDDYSAAMAQHGALNFGGYYERSESSFQQYPRLLWGYPPAVEIEANIFSQYVCKKVVPYPVSFSGNSGSLGNGNPRKLGLLSSGDPNVPVFQLFASLVKSQVQKCHGDIVIERTFPVTGHIAYDGTDPSYAASNMAAFQSQGVTTIIWAQGWETQQSKAAQSIGYFPEWVVAGDGLSEGNNNGQFQAPLAWNHAVEVTNVTAQSVPQEKPCYKGYSDTEPGASQADITGYGCWLYTNIFEVFTGVQVAGPKLSPQTVDEGFHAIPNVASNDPRVPACFFEANDYTCVKDAQAEWYDSQAQSPASSQPGCYRMMDLGKRYLADGWPDGDVMARRNTQSDPCNGYDGDNTL